MKSVNPCSSHVFYILLSAGSVLKHILNEFRSPLENDADGSLWFVTVLLTEVDDLIKLAGQKFKVMDFQAVNTIKTILSFTMELLLQPLSNKQQIQIADHIAQDNGLMSTLLLILEGHGST